MNFLEKPAIIHDIIIKLRNKTSTENCKLKKTFYIKCKLTFLDK